MRVAECICCVINGVNPWKTRSVPNNATQKAESQSQDVRREDSDPAKHSPAYVAPPQLIQKRQHITDPSVDISKYEASIFVNRYKHRLAAYRFIGDHEGVFKRKVVLDIGSGRGEGLLHLVLDKGVGRAIGIDIDQEACRFAQQMLKDYQVPNAQVMQGSASQMPDIESGTVDVVVSTATFEHVIDLDGVLKECFRVLKPGGILYAQFSPIWTNYQGAHMGKWLPFPWTHLIFSDRTVAAVLGHIQGIPHDAGTLYKHLNQKRLSEYREAASRSSFEVVKFLNVSSHPIKKVLVRLPWIGEYISGGTVLFLRKPLASTE